MLELYVTIHASLATISHVHHALQHMMYLPHFHPAAHFCSPQIHHCHSTISTASLPLPSAPNWAASMTPMVTMDLWSECVLQCVAVCCSEIQCLSLLQCVVHCVVLLQFVAVWSQCPRLSQWTHCQIVCCSVLQCVAVCCRVLQCGLITPMVTMASCSEFVLHAVCWSELQCVALLRCIAADSMILMVTMVLG